MESKNHRFKFNDLITLSLVLAKVKFKLKNEGSYLGLFWYLLNPILTFALLFLIFADRLGSSIPQYPLYLLLGIIVFNFFQTVTIEVAGGIQADRAIIKSVKFPVISLVLAILFKNFLSHFLEIALFFLIAAFFHLSPMGIFYYILILLPFSCFLLGTCLILSSLDVYFTDVEKIWNFFVRILWFATPIFYSIDGQTKLFYLNLFNPMFYFITVFREAVVYNRMPDIFYLSSAIAIGLLFLLVGLIVFNKLKLKFAELI